MGQCQSANNAATSVVLSSIQKNGGDHLVKKHSSMMVKSSNKQQGSSVAPHHDEHAEELSTTRCGSSHLLSFGNVEPVGTSTSEHSSTPALFGSTRRRKKATQQNKKKKKKRHHKTTRRSLTRSTSLQSNNSTTKDHLWVETPSVCLSDKLSCSHKSDYSWSLLCTDSDSSHNDYLEDYSSGSCSGCERRRHHRRRSSIDSVIVEEVSWGAMDLTESFENDLLVTAASP